MRLLLASTLGAMLAAGAAHAENATIRQVIDDYVIPAYADFHEAARHMRDDMERLCADPGYGGRAQAQKDFVKLAEAWSEIELIRFGPITEENRLERILFWPDRKGLGLKQVQAALAKEDPTANDPGQLIKKSVAMQGLGALEFVLFGTGFKELETNDKPYRCEYGRAIAANIDWMLTEVQTAWLDPKGIANAWANPSATNPLYRTDNESLTELLDVLVHGTELVRDVRIDGFYAQAPDDDKPKQAIYWRSDATMLSVAGNMRGLQKLFDAADFTALLPVDFGWIPQSADFEFGNAETALQRLGGKPVTDILGNAEDRKTMDYIRLVTSSLSDIVANKLAAALGLTAGFSSLDGD